MERVPTDADDRPKTDVRITGATIFVNPYKDEEEEERKVAEAERLKVCKPALFSKHQEAPLPRSKLLCLALKARDSLLHFEPSGGARQCSSR